MINESLNDLFHYFKPVEIMHPAISPIGVESGFGQQISIHQDTEKPKLDDKSVFILGTGNHKNADEIRKHLYALGRIEDLNHIVDLGNFRKGKSNADTRKGFEDVLFELSKNQKIIIVLDGDIEDIGLIINSLSRLEHPINLGLVSPDLHLISDPDNMQNTYLNRLLLNPDNQLFDFTQLAYQSYFTNTESLELLDKLYFSHVRLGELRTDIREMEPHFRNSDVLAFSMASLRYSDAPGSRLKSANGLYAEEACQLARYAGLSDKLCVFNLFDLPKGKEFHPVTANLSAQIMWHFIQGVNQRKLDYPFSSIKSYNKYIVNIPQAEHEINFYKSPKTDRWWLEVAYPNAKYPRSVYVACTYHDYQMACNGEIPDRWLKNYQRIC